MSFETVLREILDGCGGLGIALMGSDGIPILQLSPPLDSTASNPLGDDIGNAGVEFVRILSEVQKASDALNAGAMEEILVTLARFQLVFRPVDDDVILVLALPSGGNTGKARYLIRRSLVTLREEL